MDFWTNLAINAVLQVIASRRDAQKVMPALAKVFVKLEILRRADTRFKELVEVQYAKEGLSP